MGFLKILNLGVNVRMRRWPKFLPESKICVFSQLLKMVVIEFYFQWKKSVLS